jgi:hypothetical protein
VFQNWVKFEDFHSSLIKESDLLGCDAAWQIVITDVSKELLIFKGSRFIRTNLRSDAASHPIPPEQRLFGLKTAEE